MSKRPSRCRTEGEVGCVHKELGFWKRGGSCGVNPSLGTLSRAGPACQGIVLLYRNMKVAVSNS